MLPASDLPNIDFPMIQLQGGLPGASPEKMASPVATQLEHQFTTIEGPGGDELNQHGRKCGSHTGQIFGNLIEQSVEMLPNEEVCDVQDGD